MEVYVVERTELPKVAVTLATRAGGVRDPAGKGGLGTLTARVMRRGTKTRSALDIHNTLGDLGTSLTSAAGRESARLGLEVLSGASRRRSRSSPRWRSSRHFLPQINRERSWRSTGCRRPPTIRRRLPTRRLHVGVRSRSSLWAAARRPALDRWDHHPREIPSRFHQAQWKPGSSALVFVGDITLAEATALAKQHFSGWSGGAAPAAPVAAPTRVGHEGPADRSTERRADRHRACAAGPRAIRAGHAAVTLGEPCRRRRFRDPAQSEVAREGLPVRRLLERGAAAPSGGDHPSAGCRPQDQGVGRRVPRRAEPGRREADFGPNSSGAPHQDSWRCPAIRIAGPRVGPGGQSVGAATRPGGNSSRCRFARTTSSACKTVERGPPALSVADGSSVEAGVSERAP